MAELKTKQTAASVEMFLGAVESEQRRADAQVVCAMMEKITKQPPKMWGPSIVGFGSYHYKYDSGHEGDMPLTGFSPRKAALVLYILAGFTGSEELLARLGKHKTGKSCLYINKLSDVDLKILKQLIEASVKYVKAKYK